MRLLTRADFLNKELFELYVRVGLSYSRMRITLFGYGISVGWFKDAHHFGGSLIWVAPREDLEDEDYALFKTRVKWTPKFRGYIEKLVLLNRAFVERQVKGKRSFTRLGLKRSST